MGGVVILGIFFAAQTLIEGMQHPFGLDFLPADDDISDASQYFEGMENDFGQIILSKEIV